MISCDEAGMTPGGGGGGERRGCKDDISGRSNGNQEISNEPGDT